MVFIYNQFNEKQYINETITNLLHVSWYIFHRFYGTAVANIN